MAKVTAKISNHRQSPRKVRLVADLVRGKRVDQALSDLSFLAKRSSDSIRKLIQSAVANAEQMSLDPKNLVIKELRVDKGTTLHRWMPRARGRAFPIKKRSSHIFIALDSVQETPKQEAPKKQPNKKVKASVK
ncbi:50S ribosomal protein L22 [Candidatus Parcubacteria bacterium]|nr:50S ribosomal protein L22 [Candidatus Parcubacteria bacterium]